MNKYYSIFSSLISIAVILILISINKTIALQYINADGKTKALFGIIELSYSFKYFFLLGPFISGYILFKAYKKREPKIHIIGSLVFLIISLLSIFISFWNFFL